MFRSGLVLAIVARMRHFLKLGTREELIKSAFVLAGAGGFDRFPRPG